MFGKNKPPIALIWYLIHYFKFVYVTGPTERAVTLWRQRHSLMVHRMIGVKMGTGGSSGFHYLAKAAATHRVFKDLFNISTFLIPRHELPPLPPELRVRLAFVAEAS